MSRDLPPRPDLEHLKKQAKALLRSMRERDANATLADALHALARDYGFASWPKLKAHVESGFSRISGASPSASSSSAPLFPRFTEAARRTLFFSRYEAVSLGRLEIAPEHVLLGVIRGAGRTTRAMLETSGITLDAARGTIAAANAPRDEVVEPVQVPFQSSTKTLFTLAAEEADRLGHEKIATVHIVLALLRDRGVASTVLGDRGMTLEAVRAAASSSGPAARDDEND
ncbi:MAG TPA: Clp protease N-terminal domain-containing protein [Vicinamibacterales bacterium]|nr:Clp protease N-terminal domain-containing protein [Vicinamibacterales bacterium]